MTLRTGDFSSFLGERGGLGQANLGKFLFQIQTKLFCACYLGFQELLHLIWVYKMV